MSVQAISHDGHAHGHGHAAHDPNLAHQFEDMPQQNESYIVGMWAFLAYTTYRYLHPDVFIDASKHLDVLLGGINTVVLLSSSLFMALGVRAAQLQNKMGQLSWIALTILCAFGFLGIKTVEYSEKYKHHLVPGEHFRYYSVGAHGAEGGGQALESGEHSPSADGVPGPVPASGSKVPQGQAHIFFVLYFVMTGLHGIHVVIGILVLSTLWLMIKFDHPYMRYFMWVELAGLYWHFVDVVWIFLFPLYYLIPG